MANGSRAVAVLNRGPAAAKTTLEFSQVAIGDEKPWSNAHVRDLWAHKDLGVFEGSFTVASLPSHGTAMLMLTEVA